MGAQSPRSADRRSQRAERLRQGPPPSTSRAGRNLPLAVGVGVGLGVLIIASLTLWPWGFVVLATVTALVGLVEMLDLLDVIDAAEVPWPPVLAGTAIVPAAYFWGGAGLIVAWVAAMLALLITTALRREPRVLLRDVGAGALLLAYVPLLAGFTSLLLTERDGVGRVLALFLVTAASDIGAYAVGVTRGRTPMAPSISPKKSWEGFAGGVVSCVVVGVATVALLLHGPWWVGVVLGLAVVAAATIGDLVESMIKRDLGVKDMGTLLPGHGGLMDRLDSVLFAAPVVWAVLAIGLPS